MKSEVVQLHQSQVNFQRKVRPDKVDNVGNIHCHCPLSKLCSCVCQLYKMIQLHCSPINELVHDTLIDLAEITVQTISTLEPGVGVTSELYLGEIGVEC